MEGRSLLDQSGSSWADSTLSLVIDTSDQESDGTNSNARTSLPSLDDTCLESLKSEHSVLSDLGNGSELELKQDLSSELDGKRDCVYTSEVALEPQMVEPPEAQVDLTDKEINDILVGLIPGSNVEDKEEPIVQYSHQSEPDAATVFSEQFKTDQDFRSDYLPGVTKTVSCDPPTDSKDDLLQLDPTAKIQCFNCNAKFTGETFDKHICDYDSDHHYITDSSETAEVDIQSVPEQLASDGTVAAHSSLPNMHVEQHEELCRRHGSVIKMLEANNVSLYAWLKTDYKLDLAKQAQSSTNAVEMQPKKHDGPHCCTKCDRKFVHASGLTRHMEKHDHDKSAGSAWSLAMNHDPGASASLETAIKCMRCLSVFRRANDCFEHMRNAHEIERTFKETVDFSDDDLEFDESELMDIATIVPIDGNADAPQVVILSSVLHCEFCELVFSTVDALLEHSSTHDPRSGYECIGCEIRMSTVREITTHWMTECPFERFDADRKSLVQCYFVCNVCENKFTTPAKLYDHRRSSFHLYPRLSREHDELVVACEECGKVFDTAKAMVVHQQDEHQSKVRTTTKRNGADAASKGSADKLAGGVAGPESSKYRQYLCDVCGKSYTQSSHLWQHLRFHKGVKPFACKEPNCTRRFTIRPDLNDHIRKCHTGERPYHCQICGKRFLTGSVFYQHRLIHRGERRYGCDDCGKRFYRADALKNHQRIHTGEKPYACTQCQKTFRQRGDRDKHIRARHSGVLAAKEGIKMSGAGMAIAGAMSRGRIRCKKDLLLQRPPVPRMHLPFGMGAGGGLPMRQRNEPDNGDVVYVGSMAFPTSMFQPVISDIDASANLC